MSRTFLSQRDYSAGGPLLLDGVDLSIEASERIALIGRNGAGKSILLRIRAGELQPALRVDTSRPRLPTQLRADGTEPASADPNVSFAMRSLAAASSVGIGLHGCSGGPSQLQSRMLTDARDLPLQGKDEALQLALDKSLGRADVCLEATQTDVLAIENRRGFIAHFTAAARALGLLGRFAWGSLQQSRCSGGIGASLDRAIDDVTEHPASGRLGRQGWP
ncbi:MAG: ATP-binding cassette domain-containing protein [Dokdonella sp.]|nr:MAG: ATP-binding cassette domain-containing protein [Dokdonella sp.]